jgi:hypothetical protein
VQDVSMHRQLFFDYFKHQCVVEAAPWAGGRRRRAGKEGEEELPCPVSSSSAWWLGEL